MDKCTVLQGNAGVATSPYYFGPVAPLLFFLTAVFCSPVGEGGHQRYVQRPEGRKAAAGPAGGSDQLRPGKMSTVGDQESLILGINEWDFTADSEYKYQSKMWKFIRSMEMKDACFLLMVHFVHFDHHVFWVHCSGELS